MKPSALEAAIRRINDLTADASDSELAAAMARGLLFGYDSRWSGTDWETVSVEQEYHLPIINPDTEAVFDGFTHAGKVDAIASFQGRRYLVEHKTTSDSIADPNDTYWRRLEIDAQISGYVLAQWQEGVKLDGILYDVIRKPGIRPKQIERGRRHETAQEFEDRLIADTLERPGFYFRRKVVARMDSQLVEFARELWDVAGEMRMAQLLKRHYRNSSACLQWGQPCEFLGICSGHDTPDSDRWRQRERTHLELASIDANGSNVLTHSRMATFKTCRRKHYYRYELAMERQKDEQNEALYFGSLLHEALAAWWTAKIPISSEVHCG